MKYMLRHSLSKIIILFCCALLSCHATRKPTEGQVASHESYRLALPSGEVIKTSLAVTDQEQQTGLSHVKKSEFSKNQGLLFCYDREAPRRFWMPNTYMDLQIVFLNKDFTVKSVQNLKAHPSREEPIPRTETVIAKYVLEIRSDSPMAGSIKVGDQLKWISDSSLSEIISNIRSEQ